MGAKIQRSVLLHLREMNGAARTLHWLAQKVYAVERPTRSQTGTVRRALGILSGYPYFIVQRRPALKSGGGVRWMIPPLKPSPEGRSPKRGPAPSQRDDGPAYFGPDEYPRSDVWAKTVEMPLRDGKVNGLRGGICWD